MFMIRITFRQVIDSSATDVFEKNVLHYSYEEFLLKSQVYNPEGKLDNFTQMKQQDGRANSLHYKTGFAADGFIGTLKNVIPHYKDNIGKAINFESYHFELLESSVSDKSKHAVAVHYTTPRLILHQTIGEYMVLGNEEESTKETFTVKFDKNISIVFVN